MQSFVRATAAVHNVGAFFPYCGSFGGGVRYANLEVTHSIHPMGGRLDVARSTWVVGTETA